MDDIIIIGHYSFQNHLNDIYQVLHRLENKGLQVNVRKSKWTQHEVDYLGHTLTRTGIKPQLRKIRAITSMAPPQTVKQVKRFVGCINFYRRLINRRAHFLTPLTNLTRKSSEFLWTPECQDAFENIKKELSSATLLSYPNFKLPFVIHADASGTQLGGVISQNNRPIAFYSRKLNEYQKNTVLPKRSC